MKWDQRLASRMASLAPSRAVTEILKLAERPDIISFSGGLPDPAVFLTERIRECSDRIMSREMAAALNYGPNPGYTPLREWVASHMKQIEGVDSTVEDVLVTSGGLEALHLVALALLDPGDTVLVGAPTYLAALHVFRAHQTRIVSVPVDHQGLDPEALESILSKLVGQGVHPRLIYVIPSFQNPSGVTLPLSRRERLLEICRKADLPIVEDHAYAALRYRGDDLPALKAIDPDRVIFLHTFSKIFGPGVRLGWICADSGLISNLGLCKLGTDQCPNTFTQRLVLECARDGIIEAQVDRSVALYSRKLRVILGELEKRLPPSVTWTRPEGGFYTWLELPQGFDTPALLERALEDEKVAFVAGPPFFADNSGERFLRLCFSFLAEELIPEGVERLGRVISSTAQGRKPGHSKQA